MLIVCPTPIGNLDDVTPRQREALAGADVIACEDSRRTGKLLERLGIDRTDGTPRLVSYHDHNARRRTPELVDLLRDDETVVLVSDAGTPTVSDPGFRLVRAAHDAGLPVRALPGPVAAIVALSASGLPSDSFHFEGFLPARQGRRLERLRELAGLGVTILLYESPGRVVDTLEDVVEAFGGDAEVCVARELTKVHEEVLRGTAGALADELAGRDRLRGEFVVVLAPGVERSAIEADALIAALHDENLSPQAIKRIVSAVTPLSGSQVWERLEQLKS